MDLLGNSFGTSMKETFLTKVGVLLFFSLLFKVRRCLLEIGVVLSNGMLLKSHWGKGK